jgi:methylmalonyl-CoA/ethylmalonyl-CoA epimerase
VSLDLKHHHGGISVPDLEASIAWFAKVLDFEVEKRFEIAAVPAKVAMLRRGELRVELFEVAGASRLPVERREPNTDLKIHGNKHLAFAVQDIDTVAKELKTRGADIVWVRRFEFGANVFIRDNAGNLIEFVEEPLMWRE